jgi:hypothetical protein
MPAPPPRTVLLIGVHREELAFGEAVAQGLDPDTIQVLRIPTGISGVRPTQDGAVYYAAHHQELYLQILPLVRGRYDLVLDLHCGVNEPARCADLFAADLDLLDCTSTALARHPGTPAAKVRPILLASGTRAGLAPALPRAHMVIPEVFWRNPAFRYLGLECFLLEAGAGEAADWALARRLIATALACARGHPR